MNINSKTKVIAISAGVAALYVALTWAALPFSYMGVQFRISEILMLLAFYDRRFATALTVGCVLANMLSPINPLVDMIVGSSATLLAVLPMKSIKNMWIASLLPVVFNGLFVGAELYFCLGLPFALSAAQVALGEFAVCTVVGVPVMKAISKKFPLEMRV